MAVEAPEASVIADESQVPFFPSLSSCYINLFVANMSDMSREVRAVLGLGR